MAEKMLIELEPWRSIWRGLFPGHPFAALLREGPALERAAGFAPAVDLCETDTHYVVTAELPGVQQDALQVELQNRVLVIRGEKKSEREQRGERGRYLERSYGAFRRAFTLPADADAERLEVSFTDGVLTIRVPRRQAARPTRIALQR